jgi:translocation and assembly module TamB
MTPKGLFELHSETELDLKRLDPLLNAEGRRLRGLLTVNSKLAGTWPSTSITGSAQLNNGEWQDYALGVKISDISATLSAEDGTIRIAKLQGRSGPGTLSASGSIGLLKGMPVDLNITASNARPLASDRLTVNLDADVSLRGLAAEQLAATGRIQIKRAEIRIPERMPTSIAVLKTSHDAAPPAQSEAGSKFALDLTIAASREIYLRGRGMDAELGGSIHVTGTDQELRPDGRFQLRRGQFTLAGQTLVFSQGSVGFDNGSLTNPSLNFIANTSRDTISASLTVAGSALKPTIMLSSTPELPQDEIMANLLFGHGSATLSPLEMLQIASALASLSGINVGIDDPLESARKRLGLDRLSAGGASPSVEGGRYIAPGVYLGAKQGISGGKPQASLQIDVTKRLKLEGSVGSGVASGTSTTNSFGVIYQFEY